MKNKEPPYCIGDLVRKVAGNLDKGEVGTVLAVTTAYRGETIYRVLVDEEVKNWYGEFVIKIEKKNAA